MANTVNLTAEVGANMIGDDAQPTVVFTNSSTGAGLQTDRLVVTSFARRCCYSGCDLVNK